MDFHMVLVYHELGADLALHEDDGEKAMQQLSEGGMSPDHALRAAFMFGFINCNRTVH